uniref:Uncharacterized protein n=1 Tax=Micrurus paraensis TaxID=1970185 RepID=A0A2D4KPE1_9SAUR
MGMRYYNSRKFVPAGLIAGARYNSYFSIVNCGIIVWKQQKTRNRNRKCGGFSLDKHKTWPRTYLMCKHLLEKFTDKLIYYSNGVLMVDFCFYLNSILMVGKLGLQMMEKPL